MTQDAHIEALLTQMEELVRQGRGEEAIAILREVQRLMRERIH